MTLAGRRFNDRMGSHITQELFKALLARKTDLSQAQVLVLGFTFKENCTNTYNTRVADIIEELAAHSVATDLYDPWIDTASVAQDYGLDSLRAPNLSAFEAINWAVVHIEFKEMAVKKKRRFGKTVAIPSNTKECLVTSTRT